MAASSPETQDLQYLYASNTNVSNFVSVKLSGKHNYHRWRTQMLCLMETHDMSDIVDDDFVVGPRASSERPFKKQYDSLVKGWIFGSLSDSVFDTVVDLDSVKDVWRTLKHELGSARDFQPQQDEIETESENAITCDIEAADEIETESENASDIEAANEIETESEHAITSDIEAADEIETESKHAITSDIEAADEIETKSEHAITGDTDIEAGKDTIMSEEAEKTQWKKLHDATRERNWLKLKEILENDEEAMKMRITDDGGTVIHMVCLLGYDDLLEKLLLFIKEEEVQEILEKRTKDGSTALHAAVSVGNKYAMKLLVGKHADVLTIPDTKLESPVIKALHCMQFDTFQYLFNAVADNHKFSELLQFSRGPDEKKGAILLVNAITAKQYGTALQIIEAFPNFAAKNDEVLMAIARTFPSELNYWEKLIYPPSLDARLEKGALLSYISGQVSWPWRESKRVMGGHSHPVLKVPMCMFFLIRGLIRSLIWMAFFPSRLLLLLFWKVVPRLVPHIKNKRKELVEAKMVLKLVCDEIDKLSFTGAYHPYYESPLREAAVQNAYRVIDVILQRSRRLAIESGDKKGYNLFQIAVIHRANLLYVMGKDKTYNSRIIDSDDSNLLHVAGKLAPPYVLKRRTGAALQLQGELRFFEELKKFMHPSDLTKQNFFGETPPMVFTREHEKLVKEGEKWMITTAESCSISAALITTIVFAAAITVPGGSNQETGMPMFRKDIAFTIFALADAISLFTSTSSLMVFLSILTARFNEADFLVSLPRRLIIGLCTLSLSITAMMVAFGATLYLLFCHEKPWMVGPICGLACLPVLFFVTLQLPLIADLYGSTYVPIFDK